MEVSCQCGNVSFTTPTPAPIDLYHCHCTDCRAQSASAFGTSAIFPAEGILPLNQDLRDRLEVWIAKADSGNTKGCYFCKICGVRVFHIRLDPPNPQVVSIKGGLVKGLDWKDGKHIYCRSAVVEIPAGAQRWDGSDDSNGREAATVKKD